MSLQFAYGVMICGLCPYAALHPIATVEMNLLLIDVILNFCEAREVVILGDFNLLSLLWSAGVEMSGASQNDQLFLDCFSAAGLSQWVEEATFGILGNILDLFLTSETDRVEVLVLPSIPRSGHSPLVCDYLYSSDLDADSSEDQQIYLWHRGNYGKLSEALSRVDWELEFKHLSVNLKHIVFLHIVNGLIDRYIPMCFRSPRSPWSVNPPAALKTNRANAWKHYKSLRSRYGRHSETVIEALVRFNAINYRFRHYVTRSRGEYEQRLVDNYAETPKLFHAYICKKGKGFMPVGPVRLPCKQPVDSSRHVAELFTNTFASVFVDNDPFGPVPYQVYEGRMHAVNITVHKVCAALQCLNVSSAVGPDNLHPRVLKMCALQLSVLLAMIFKNLFETGSLPEVWLKPIVIPLFKAKSRYDPGNY